MARSDAANQCVHLGRRGPKAKRLSRGTTPKVRCGYLHCKRNVDCRNAGDGLRLRHDEVDVHKVRATKSNSSHLRFCCSIHLERAKKAPEVVPRGPREVLTMGQCGLVFEELVLQGKPWCAVLFLLQTILGERAQCATMVRWSWFLHLQSSKTGALPKLNIPPVNGKTRARTVPLPIDFVTQLRQWLQHPLRGPNGTQWPWADQPCHGEHCLFPGRGKTGERRWSTPITSRGYSSCLTACIQSLAAKRQARAEEGKNHGLDDVDLTRVGTHSCKRSMATNMRDSGVSGSIVSAICGTSERTIEQYYICPTQQRQRQALNHTGATTAVLSSSSSSSEVPGACNKRKRVIHV